MSLVPLFAIALLAFAVAEAWRRWALRRGVLDRPGARSSHVVPTPRGGGIGIAVAVVAGTLWFSPPGPAGVLAAVALVLVAGVGLADDLRPLAARWKFLGQGLAVLPAAWALQGGVPVAAIDPVRLLGEAVVLGFLVNAWNFMDGIDGIAAGSAAAVAVVALLFAGSDSLAPAAVLLAACIGFLPLNAPRARLFMGDVGSHVLGLSVGLVVLGAGRAEGAPTLAAAAASLPFVIDVLGTLLRRARDREPLATAHRRHLYQLAVRNGYSHARVAALYAALALLIGGSLGMLERTLDVSASALSIPAVALAVAWVMARRRLARRLEGESA